MKPDFHLCLVELKRACNFDAPGAGQVLVEVELLLQLCQLLRREVGSACVVDAAGTGLTCVPVLVGLRNCCKKIKIMVRNTKIIFLDYTTLSTYINKANQRFIK